ncbi:MAG: hypothetical protein ACKOXZ_06135, partial [Polynucleobacter victoriensis]
NPPIKNAGFKPAFFIVAIKTKNGTHPFTIPSMKSYLKKIIVFSAILANSAGAIDLLPGDVVAPKPDVHLLQFSYQRIERGDYYQNNRVALNNNQIINSQLQVKYGRSFEIQNL